MMLEDNADYYLVRYLQKVFAWYILMKEIVKREDEES